MPKVNFPDPQHLMLDALHKEVYRLLEDEVIDGEDVQYLFEGEPESVVFTCDDLHDFESDEDRYDTVMLVGARDLAAKIDYWTARLRDIQDRDNA